MRVLVTGATGFLGSRSCALLAERGHYVVAVARPGGAARSAAAELEVVRMDAGVPEARELVAGCDAVFHFAGVPDPARAREDPARAIRENAGSTLNLLDACLEHGAGLLYPSTLRAAVEPPPDDYALSKRLGEEVCRLHPAPATVVRFTSVYGPGQVAWEGATGAIAVFAARALKGEPIVIYGDPERTRDFLFVDDALGVFEHVAQEGRWNETVPVASGVATSLRHAAELVREAAGSSSPIEAPGGELPPGENESYAVEPPPTPLAFTALEEGIPRYVDWLETHASAQGRARA